VIDVRHISRRFGRLVALKDFSLSVRPEELGITIGAQPKSFVPIVGNFSIGAEGDNKVLVIDGRSWKHGQTAAGLAEHAKSLYGERYGEFLDNVRAFAYFPYAVATGIDDFRQGEISLRFKPLSGRIDQGAGILFNLKPNGDYASSVAPKGEATRHVNKLHGQVDPCRSGRRRAPHGHVAVKPRR
jgi:hypothetical protein